MRDEDFKAACELAFEELQKLAPYDTGNLALNAIRIEFTSSKRCVIYVDESIAPYMPYTTEKWLSPYWRGKKNPNEGWFESAVQLIAEVLADLCGGELHVNA